MQRLELANLALTKVNDMTPESNESEVKVPSKKPYVRAHGVDRIAKWANCSTATIYRLCKEGKFRVTRDRGNGNKFLILNTKTEVHDIIAKNLTKHGWKINKPTTKRVVISRKQINAASETNKIQGILAEFLAWRNIPDEKRSLLITLGEQSTENLKLFLELIS